MLLSPDLFYHWREPRTIVDVRPAGSFIKGSFYAAVSLPPENFTSCAGFLSALRTISEKSTVHVVDLDGSLLSKIVNELNLYGLAGGYKSFKIWRENVFSNGPPLGIIGGKTGSGKTEVLHSLIEKNRQVIDLEKLAKHKGSVFGNLSGTMQPANECFQNKLLELWFSFDPAKPVWVEEKGPVLGTTGLPPTFYTNMLRSLIVELEVSREERLQHIQKEYCKADNKSFIQCIRKLERRTGVSADHKAIHYCTTGQMEKCLSLLLAYYDEAYENRRKLYQSECILRSNPSLMKRNSVIDHFEREIMAFHKLKNPAVMSAGELH